MTFSTDLHAYYPWVWSIHTSIWPWLFIQMLHTNIGTGKGTGGTHTLLFTHFMVKHYFFAYKVDIFACGSTPKCICHQKCSCIVWFSILCLPFPLQEFGNHDNVIKLLNVIKAENDKDIYLVFEFMGEQFVICDLLFITLEEWISL